MAITVRNIPLWRKEIENQPGSLATTLEPIANAGADLQVIMAYRYPGNQAKAVVELCPISGKKLMPVAEKAGLHTSGIPALLYIATRNSNDTINRYSDEYVSRDPLARFELSRLSLTLLRRPRPV